MLSLASFAQDPSRSVLVKIGALERLFMQQAAVADAWSSAHEASKEKDKDQAISPSQPAAAAASTVATPPAPGEAGETSAAGVGTTAQQAPSRAVEGGGADGPAIVPPHLRPLKKKGPDEIAHDILHHSISMLRGFTVAIAKSIHTPARR